MRDAEAYCCPGRIQTVTFVRILGGTARQEQNTQSLGQRHNDRDVCVKVRSRSASPGPRSCCLPARCHRQTGSLASMTPKPICPMSSHRQSHHRWDITTHQHTSKDPFSQLPYITADRLILPEYPELEDSALVSAIQARLYSASRRITTFIFAATDTTTTKRWPPL